MTEEQIKELARSLGLDTARLTLFEPFNRNFLEGLKQYRMEYEHDDKRHDWNFLLTREDLLHEAIAVEFYVNEGLRKLAHDILRLPII